jgi:hypothetical protein
MSSTTISIIKNWHLFLAYSISIIIITLNFKLCQTKIKAAKEIKVEAIIHNEALPGWTLRNKEELPVRAERLLMKKAQDMNGIARKQEKQVKKVVNHLEVEIAAVNH